MKNPKRLLIIAVAVLGIIGLSACDPEPSAKPRVLVLGDSITTEVKGSPHANLTFSESASSVDWGGARFWTAPCDGLAYAKKINYRPDVVVFNYSGNSGHVGADNCMNGEKGAALTARYKSDLQKTINHFKNGHTKFVVVGAPHRPGIDAKAIMTGLKQVATANGVPYRAVTHDFTVNGKQARSVACASFDGTQCGKNGGGAGKVLIRSANLDHLCPNSENALIGTCKVYNAGAMRLARHMNAGVKQAAKPR